MKRRTKRLRMNQKGKFHVITKVIQLIKNDPVLFFTIIGVVISAVILIFMLKTYESPPNVKCSVDLVQRPDSIFQFHLHIWNEGDRIANDIIIQAIGKDAFQWDTSGAKGKSLLYVYPVFSIYIDIAPGNNDFHKITIPQLGNSKREDNYLIICPHVYKVDYYKTVPNLILREKFINLKPVTNMKSYYEELTENLKVFYAGNSLPFEIENKIDLNETMDYNFIYPTYEQFIDYRQRSINSNNTIQQNEIDEGKKKNDKKDDSWFPFF